MSGTTAHTGETQIMAATQSESQKRHLRMTHHLETLRTALHMARQVKENLELRGFAGHPLLIESQVVDGVKIDLSLQGF